MLLPACQAYTVAPPLTDRKVKTSVCPAPDGLGAVLLSHLIPVGQVGVKPPVSMTRVQLQATPAVSPTKETAAAALSTAVCTLPAARSRTSAPDTVPCAETVSRPPRVLSTPPAAP